MDILCFIAQLSREDQGFQLRLGCEVSYISIYELSQNSNQRLRDRYNVEVKWVSVSLH